MNGGRARDERYMKDHGSKLQSLIHRSSFHLLFFWWCIWMEMSVTKEERAKKKALIYCVFRYEFLAAKWSIIFWYFKVFFSPLQGEKSVWATGWRKFSHNKQSKRKDKSLRKFSWLTKTKLVLESQKEKKRRNLLWQWRAVSKNESLLLMKSWSEKSSRINDVAKRTMTWCLYFDSIEKGNSKLFTFQQRNSTKSFSEKLFQWLQL